MGKVVQFPKPPLEPIYQTPGIKIFQIPEGEASVCNMAQLAELPAFVFDEKPVAKSSTSVMQAAVCQTCGCKLDGLPLKKVCTCKCHVTGAGR